MAKGEGGRRLFYPSLFMIVVVGAIANQVLIAPLVNKFLNRSAAA